MDTLTHALSGALIARATAPKEAPDVLPLRRRVLLGFLAAAAPDLDFVAGFFGQITYLYHHRGITHSLILLPLWSFLLAHLCALLWRRDRPWHAYLGAIAIGIGAHILGDWITSFGTMMLAPLTDERYALALTFIIDLWFTGIIVAGLAAGLIWRNSRAPAIAGCAILCAYVGFQGVQQQRAMAWGESYARSAGLTQATVAAQPRPVSPFNWMVIVRDGDEAHYSLVNLVRSAALPVTPEDGFIRRLDAVYLPLAQAQWVRTSRFGTTQTEREIAHAAWTQPQFGFFRWFAAEPVLLRVDIGNPQVCAWFQDLRFFTPGRGSWPFRYGMCRSGETGRWDVFQLIDDTARRAVR